MPNLKRAIAAIAFAMVATAQPATAQDPAAENRPVIMESLPPKLAASAERHRRAISSAGQTLFAGASSILVPQQSRWQPGSTVTVAFMGGDDALYAEIEKVAQEWTGPGVANVKLSFRDASGKFRKWSYADAIYKGDIRVGFNGLQFGSYWSHVGTDSRNRQIDGGRPGEQSMNFQDFDLGLPWNWRTVVLHEFGHALGFQHEHQSPATSCAFRFEDDAGYMATKTAKGMFIPDSQDRRPGLYTYLGGWPNNWERPKVDANLRTFEASSMFDVGPFDAKSIMLYVFDKMMFIDPATSPCYIEMENGILSEQDRKAAALAYRAGAAGAADGRAAIQTTEMLREVKGISAALRKTLDQQLRYRTQVQ